MRHATDAVSRVLAAFEKVLDRSDIEVEVTDDDLRSLARARPDDKVQKLIGTAPERREEEAARRYRLEQFLLDDTGEILKTLGEVRYQTSKSGSQGLSARELDALLSIEEYWRRQEGIADDRTMPLIADVPDEIVEGSDYSVYEKLGDTAVDADRAAA
jgi:hypothetical protein